MGYYAKVLNGRVIDVIAADASYFDTFVDSTPGTWLQTSYNTRGNVHYAPNSDTPDGGVALRGNYAGIGMIYNVDYDVFYTDSPYPSWILNHDTWLWQAPVPMPQDGQLYRWDEDTLSWVVVPPQV